MSTNTSKQDSDMEKYFFRASVEDFEKIPGRALAYWASEEVFKVFSSHGSIGDKVTTREGLTTGSNDLFLRFWHEISVFNIGKNIKNNKDAISSNLRFFPYIKGGSFRKWSGNFEFVVNWFQDGIELKEFKDERTGRVRSHNYNGNYGDRKSGAEGKRVERKRRRKDKTN